MHELALSVIEEVGIEIRHEKVKELLLKESGAWIKGDSVFFSPQLVKDCTADVSYQKGEEFKLLSGAYCLNILDMRTKEVRAPTSDDLVEMTKLADSFGMEVIAPVSPQDIPPSLREVAMFKIALENSERAISGGVVTSVEAAEYIYQMSQVANKYFSLGLWVISPLKLETSHLDIILHFLDREVPMFVGNMPMVGATSPIFIPGSFVQSIAETLAAATVLKLISKGGSVNYRPKDSFMVYPFDMKYGTLSWGACEYLPLTLVQMQVARYFSLPPIAKSLLSMGKEPDAQVAAEKAAHTAVAALAGAESFSNAGLLSGDDIFSPEQLVIDYEIVNYIKQFMKGFQFDKNSLAFDIIKEVGKEGNYLTHETTLQNYRQVFFFPELFEHDTLKQWKGERKKSIREKAKEIAFAKLDQHEFELPWEVQKELDAIYKKASEELT